MDKCFSRSMYQPFNFITVESLARAVMAVHQESQETNVHNLCTSTGLVFSWLLTKYRNMCSTTRQQPNIGYASMKS